MNKAFKKIKSNKGSHGIDGMKVDELLQYIKENGDHHLRQTILYASYLSPWEPKYTEGDGADITTGEGDTSGVSQDVETLLILILLLIYYC